MRSKLFATLLSCAGMAALAFTVVPSVAAQCGMPNKPISPMSWQPQQESGHASYLQTAFTLVDDNEPSIVGMWHVTFTALTQNGVAVPVTGGVIIDNAVAVWHSDGTEIMNSSRSAQDGNFCLGVWKQTGPRGYLLNHIPWQGNIFDPTAPPNAIGPPQGGAQILEKINLNPNGNSYTGTFTLHAYDTSGNVYVWFSGTLSAERITPDTPFSDLL
jgi:hypothetical protein